MAWAVIGWCFLGLLCVLLLLLVLPVTISAEYREKSLTVYVRVLFVRMRLFPQKSRVEKKTTSRPAKDKKAQTAKKEKKKIPRTLYESIEFVRGLTESGWAAVKVYLRHVRIHRVQMVLPVHGIDAADTALQCGRVQAAVGAVRAVLDDRLYIRYKRLEVLPDFSGQLWEQLLLACKVSFCPGIIFPMGIAFLKQHLKRRFHNRAAYKQALARKRARQKAAQQKDARAA